MQGSEQVAGCLVNKIKNQKGQVALFVALIFQVLFVFFAMVINVGLLVHHKINLQNSVDLAAYYGAAKQAENLNAIAHMNYQVRQSWKLLSWRYRMLGSAGDFSVHPYKKYPPYHLDTQAAIETVDPNGSVMNNFEEAPAFCITYVPMKPMPTGENTCKDLSQFSGITLFKTPQVFGFISLSKSISVAATALRDAALQRCKYFGSWNYVMLGKFTVAFNNDQSDRVTVINELSRTMSEHSDDFFDLDGDSVKDGIEKTLKKNLTAPNRDSYQTASLKVYNSLADPKCGVTTDKDRPVKWLSAIKIYPGFNYIDTDCVNNGNAGGNIQSSGKEFTDFRTPDQLPTHRAETDLASAIDQISHSFGYRDPLSNIKNFSLGVEKNPWCMAYVGVAAETQPSVPFSPFGSIKIKARAFAKPFGGRIGPWHKEAWSRRELDIQYSDTGQLVDPLIPPRVTDISQIAGSMTNPQYAKIRAANFSRYVGDPYGLKSAAMIGYYGKSIYELDPQWNLGMVTNAPGGLYNNSTAPDFFDWDALPDDFLAPNGTGDILAWSKESNGPSKMRLLEMTAVAPNTFDAAYYSIEPDFFHNYYTRMKKGFIAKAAPSVDKNFRPDIGYHRGGGSRGQINYDEYSVRDQISEVNGPNAQQVIPPLDKVLTFPLESAVHVLTGWTSKDLTDYSMNDQIFGKCSSHPEAGVPNPGDCVVGGSTGYSVKMISSDYLNSQELKLGGEQAAKGPLLNPPPMDF